MTTTINESTISSGQSRAAYANMLKEFYADLWDHHVHTGTKIMKFVGKKKGRMGGRRVVAAVVDQFPQSAGLTIFEGGKMPTPRVGRYFNPEILSRGIFTRLRWTVESELAARGGKKAAWARPRKVDVEHANKQFEINLERKAFMGYGDLMGEVTSHAVVSSVSVLTLRSRDERTSTTPYRAGNFYMRENQSINVVRSAQGALGDPGLDFETAMETYITARGGSFAAPTITLNRDLTLGLTNDGNATPAAGDLITTWQNRRAAIDAAAGDAISDFSGFNGIFNLATDTTHYSHALGLSKTTYPTLAGVYDDNAGTARPFEERLVTLMVDKVYDNGTGNEPDCLVLNRATRREVLNEHSGDRRYAPIQTESGFGKLVAHVGDVQLPYESMWQAPTHMVMTLNKSSWGWCGLADMSPVDQSLERWVTDRAQHEMLWHKHGNIWNQRPYDNGILDDITTSVDA